MRQFNFLPVIGLILAVVVLAACAGVRYPSYYLLNPVVHPVERDVGGSFRPLPGAVAVRPFSAPGFLREGPIAYRPAPEQLNFYNFHRWAVDPRQTTTRAVVDTLRNRGLFQAVALFDGNGSPAFLLTGTLDHLEEVDSGADVSIEVGISARLVDLKSGDTLWQGSSSKNGKVGQRSVSGTVAEMSRELGSAVDALVSSLQDRVATHFGT
jgi:uncharacterized lipoprotein YmbA